MYKVSKFESAKAPKVKQVLSIEDVLQIIKNGDEYLQIINTARLYGKGSAIYDNIKTNLLPSFRFNFLFEDSASNKNIIASTGLIYLDVDGVDTIPTNDYIFASWKSLSNKGYGLLVKVDNLTLDNYSNVYNQLTEIIGINSDAGARKATQQTILSYDKNLYCNPNSNIYNYSENKKVSNHPILEEREECIVTNDTFLSIDSDTIQFNNIESYFTNEYENELYRVFDEKIKICSPFIPIRIEVGKRNSTLFYLLSQYALLNPKAGKQFFKAISETINKKMYPRLESNEIESIINSVLLKREDNSLKLFYNEERKILFNPNALITGKEKMKIVNQVLGNIKSQLTKETIYIALENWDFESYGAITQKKIVELTGKSIATVKRYWKEFKSYTKDLNNDYKAKSNIQQETNNTIAEGAIVDNSNRITLNEFFKRFLIRYGSFVDVSTVENWEKVFAKHFTYVDELNQEAKEICKVTFRYGDGRSESKLILKDL